MRKLKHGLRLTSFNPLKVKFCLRSYNNFLLESTFSKFKKYLLQQGICDSFNYITFKNYWTSFFFFLLKRQERFFFHTIGRYNCIIMKKKRSNYYLTLTNGFGMVRLNLSSGAFVKGINDKKRNRKIRARYIYYNEYQAEFIRKLRRKKIKYIKYFLQRAGLRKRFRYNIIYGLSSSRIMLGYIKNLPVRGHSLKKKSRKKRRL